MAAVEEKKWFVLRVISGKEKKSKEYIDAEIKRSGWSEIISQVLAPTEKVFKIVGGKKVLKERIVYPGYILLEASQKKLHGDIIATIRNTTGVINFLGGNVPQALRKIEVNRLLGTVDEMSDAAPMIVDPFVIGESVKIIEGSFNDFIGVIDEINDEKKKLKVSVKIFGRKTPVDLTFAQVEKQA